MDGCLFCKIVAGDIAAEFVYRDDDVVVLRDIQPQAPVHLLVLPTKHISTFGDVDAGDELLMGKLVRAAARAAASAGIIGSGYRSVVNAGRDAQQSVPHLHIHVLGGRHLGWPPG